MLKYIKEKFQQVLRLKLNRKTALVNPNIFYSKTKVVKTWFSDEYNDYYCKHIENGHEVIHVITRTCFEKLGNGKVQKTFYFAGESFNSYPADRVVILGRVVDEVVRLKYLNQKLTKKVVNQAEQLTMQQKAVMQWIEAHKKVSTTLDKLKKEVITANDLSKCLIIARDQPVLGLTSSDEKERKLVELIVKELSNERKA